MTRLALSLALAGLFATTAIWSQAQAEPLRQQAVAALGFALQDERDAQALYAAVLARFDGAKPFANIIAAERRHEAMLTELYTAHGVAVPENGPATGSRAAPLAPDSLVDACKAGVAAELANRDRYDVTLLPAVVAYPDITRVMQRLRDASENNHLPASQQAWAETDPGPAPEDLTNHLETVEA